MLPRAMTAIVLTIALVAGVVTGCGGKGAPTTEATRTTVEDGTEAAEETGQSTGELVAELKGAIANAPTFTSVTITKHDLASYASEEGDATKVFALASVYKCESNGSLRTSMEADDPWLSVVYCTVGDAVYATGGPVYSATTEQFDCHRPRAPRRTSQRRLAT